MDEDDQLPNKWLSLDDYDNARDFRKNVEEGDLFPIHTPMGNTIYVDFRGWWTYGINNGRRDMGLFMGEKAILAFVDELDFRYQHDLKSHIMGTGDLGSGKSTFSMVLYRVWKSPLYNDKERLKDVLKTDSWTIQDFLRDSPLDMKDCCFKLEELRERIKENVSSLDPTDPSGRRKIYQRQFYIMDESGKELSSHRWQDRYVEEMKQQLDISRVKREIIMMNLPHLRGIIKGIRDSNADYLTYCMGDQQGQNYNRGVVEIREAEKNRWEQEIFWKGSMALKFPKLDDSSYYDYQDKKLHYVEASGLESEVHNELIEYRALIGARLQNPVFMRKQGLEALSQTKTGEILDVDRKTIRNDSRRFLKEYGRLKEDS